jgi:hypothetical protein
MVLPFGFLGAFDLYIKTDWNNLESTEIDKLPDTGVVKIEGVISGEPNAIVISGEEYDTDSGYNWEWNDDESFMLNDSSGSIPISTERYYEMAEGPHPAPNSPHDVGSVYEVGDEVTIVGEVDEKDGEKVVYLFWIGTKDSEIEIPLSTYLAVFGILLPCGIGYIIFFIFHFKRNKLHHLKAGYSNPIIIAKTDMQKPPGLEWLRNGILNRTAKSTLIGMSIITGLVFLFLMFIIFNSLFHTFSDRITQSAITMLVVPFMIFLPLAFYFERSSVKPDEIACSRNGVHFYYKNYILRFLKDDFIGWEEIKDIRYRSSGKSGSWIIEKKNDTDEVINAITKKNRKFIIDNWVRWKVSNRKK